MATDFTQKNKLIIDVEFQQTSKMALIQTCTTEALLLLLPSLLGPGKTCGPRNSSAHQCLGGMQSPLDALHATDHQWINWILYPVWPEIRNEFMVSDKKSYQQQLVAFNKASKGWLKEAFYRTGSLAPRLTPHLEAVGITLLLAYAVVPQSFLPKETIQCGGAWTGPTENNMHA